MRTKPKGLFITFEGIDGCGKTTQLALVGQFLTEQGYRVHTLREPGSTEIAEKIRELLLDERSAMTDVTELLLYEAARAEITSKEIAPLLRRGHVVLCDRFYDSTTAYQGFGRKLDIRMVKSLHRVAVGDVEPDLTLVFDLNPRMAAKRLGGKLDRLESQSPAFHKRVRQGFLEIARKEGRRVKVIDAERSVEQIFEDVKTHLVKKLRRR
jgi:dTMP kinase